jgi:rSAM/selenodomain-associated transferase 2
MKISVIVPTLNEENNLKKCIECIRSEGIKCEIIVSDGGSSDNTIKLAGGYKEVKIVRTDKGRGRQMNKGASVATGEILLFLHADTVLEKGWSNAVMSLCESELYAGGVFTLKIDNPGKIFRIIEYLVKVRCYFFKLPYGDQGIIVKKCVFEKIGGFKNIPLMEDIDIVERIKMQGEIKIFDKNAVTSDRRWAAKGWVYTSVLNHLIFLLYRLGLDPHRLARLYYR